MIWVNLLALIIVVYAISLAVRIVVTSRLALPCREGEMPPPLLVVLIPALREQAHIEETIRHILRAPLGPQELKVIVVTTAAEESFGEGKCTADVVDEVAAELNAARRFRAVHRIHYPYSVGSMAHQINYAVRYLFEAFDEEINPDRTVIGIFNADSRPPGSTLLAARAEVSASRPVVQCCSMYVSTKPRTFTTDGAVLGAAALWQTRWSLGVEYWRARFDIWLHSDRLKSPPSIDQRPSPIAPYNYLIGHGLFIRLRELIELNYLPQIVGNEDAALGFLLPYYGVHPTPLAHPDVAEVPASISILVRQQAAWIVGPACAANYARYVWATGLSRSFSSVAILAIKALWDAFVWVAGPIAFLVSLLMCWSSTVAALLATAFLVYLWLPTIALAPLASSIFPRVKYPLLSFIIALGGLPIFYMLHGIGGMIGLGSLIRSLLFKQPLVRHKTERSVETEI
jgi:hypothetical protein